MKGPRDRGLTNAWSSGIGLDRGGETETKRGEALVFGLDEAFWDASDRTIYRRAAQLTFTVAALEAGKQVVLLRNGVPAQASLPDGGNLDISLERADFRSVRPWIEIAQPVAGATVGATFPVSFVTRTDDPVRIEVIVEGNVVKRKRLPAPGGSLRISETERTNAIVRMSQDAHFVDLPLNLAAR